MELAFELGLSVGAVLALLFDHVILPSLAVWLRQRGRE
jgi:preprotein translocase subunit SecF